MNVYHGDWICNCTSCTAMRERPTLKWQKCPVCNGTGLVSRPPWVAGDQMTWTSSDTGPYKCKACDGKMMVITP